MGSAILPPRPETSFTLLPLAVKIAACTGRLEILGYEARSSEGVMRIEIACVTEPAKIPTPSWGDVNKFSPSNAQYFELQNRMETSIRDVPDFRVVQSEQSGEVRTVPFNPTATYWSGPKVTAYKYEVVPEFREVQSAPFGEVRMMPSCPTATNWVPP